MSKVDRAEQRREERALKQLEGKNYTYAQVQSLVMQRDRLVQKMYSGLRKEVNKLGYKEEYTDGVWTLTKEEEKWVK